MNPIYQFTIPVYTKALHALDKLLIKIAGQMKERGVEEAMLLEARLAPDMFPLKRQIQIACDNAKGGAARLAGVDVPSHPDDEKTIEELRARIAKVLAFISTFTEDQFQDAADRHITLPYFPDKYLTGFEYAREYSLPNFFFHVSAAYAILRKEGFDIGKSDYMGDLPWKPMGSV
jgi:uncharacterized protein